MYFQRFVLFISLTLLFGSCNQGTATADFLSVSIYILPFILVLVFFNLSELYRAHKRARVKTRFFTFKRFRTAIVAFSMILFTSIVVFLLPDNSPSTPAELTHYGQLTKTPELELEGLRLQHFESPEDPLITYHYFKKVVELDEDFINTNSLIGEYKSKPGHYFELACLNTLKLDFDKAQFYVFTLNEDKPVVCYLKGQVALYNRDSANFVNYLIKEIENEGLKTEAYPLLAGYFLTTNQPDLLYDLVKSDTYLNYLPNHLAGSVYFQHGDIIRYVSSIFLHLYHKLNSYSFIGAFIILFAYTTFLRELDLFNKEKWGWVILLVGFGVISPFFVFPFSDFLSYSLGWLRGNTLLSEFLFFTVNVGLVEEFVKLFPFILLLLFTKKLKEPYDYMLYTSLVAFGFAFTENLIYFTDQGTGIIQVRGMLSVIGHAMFTSTVGYLLAFSRFKKPLAPPAVLIVLGLILAALLHGTYNFLIGSQSGILLLKVAFFAYFLALVHMWSIMLNNCINNSSHFNFSDLPKLKDFHFKATVVLLSIIITEYLLTSISIGKTYAFESLVNFFYPGLYLVLFLSNTLGRFDFFKNYWESVVPPYRELLFPRTANTNEYVGKQICITPNETNKLAHLGELKGTIVERKIYRNSTNWFVVHLLNPLPIREVYPSLLFIEFGASGVSLEDELNSECEIYVVPDSIDYKKIKIAGTLLRAGEAKLNLLIT